MGFFKEVDLNMNRKDRDKLLNDIDKIGSTNPAWINISTKKVKILFRYVDILERALMISDDEIDGWLKFVRSTL